MGVCIFFLPCGRLWAPGPSTREDSRNRVYWEEFNEGAVYLMCGWGLRKSTGDDALPGLAVVGALAHSTWREEGRNGFLEPERAAAMGQLPPPHKSGGYKKIQLLSKLRVNWKVPQLSSPPILWYPLVTPICKANQEPRKARWWSLQGSDLLGDTE